MSPASYVGEPNVTCRVCGVSMAPIDHERHVIGPVAALMPGGTSVEDWRREAHRRSMRAGQFADMSIYPDEANDREIDILVARILHHDALRARVVSPREAAVA